MSHVIEINNTIMDLKITTVESINADAPLILSIYQSLKRFGVAAMLKELDFDQDVGDPNLYAYRVERKNGMVFDATLAFTTDDDLDPLATIALSVAWRKSMWEPAFRPLADQLVDLRALVGLITLTVVFA